MSLLEQALGLRPRTQGGVSRGLSLASFRVTGDLASFSLMSLPTPRGRGALLKAGLFSPHAGRGMSTVTTWSERCASSGSIGNSSGTQYPPRSTWRLVVPHVRHPINHRSSIPLVPNRLCSGQRARCLSPEGVNPGDFKANDSNIGRDGHVALHNLLEPWGPISSLPLSLLWPQALLRAGPRVSYLSTTWGCNYGGLLGA
jgi:hypothetical protein